MTSSGTFSGETKPDRSIIAEEGRSDVSQTKTFISTIMDCTPCISVFCMTHQRTVESNHKPHWNSKHRKLKKNYS